MIQRRKQKRDKKRNWTGKEYQTKARRKKIMMLLCLIIAGTLGTYMAGRWLELF